MRFVLLVLFFLIPSLLCASEVEQQIARLGDGSFQVREDAHQNLLNAIAAKVDGMSEAVLKAYKDPDVDPETRVRLLNVLRNLVRGTSFAEKNGFIGIGIDVTNVAIDGKRFSAVLVRTVMADMQGAEAGLAEFDRIYKINGKPFETASVSDEFMKRIGYKSAGDKIKLSLIRRNNEQVELEVELMKRPGDIAPGIYDPEEDFKETFDGWMKENGARP